jgi:hypothetical protein
MQTNSIVPTELRSVKRARMIPVKKTLTRIDRDRGICRRSERMSLTAALALCKRLNNLAHIHQPEVVAVIRSSRFGDTAIVQWEAERSEAKEALRMAFRASRLATAAKQSAVMSFYVLAGMENSYVCINDDLHGDISHVLDLTNDECDCDDFKFRCLMLGERCHHLHEAHHRLEAGTLPGFEPVKRQVSPDERAARHARCQANLNRDF